MTTKNILGFGVAIVVLFGIIWIARPNQNSNKNSASVSATNSVSGGALVAEVENYDFGTISMKNGDAKYSIKVKNNGNEPVTLGKMYTSCMCTTATLQVESKKFGPYGMPGHGLIPKINKSLNAGEEAIVEVIFDPNAHGPAGVGRIERVVTIENSTGQDLEFGFTALVTP